MRTLAVGSMNRSYIVAMQITRNTFTISDLVDWLNDGSLKVNRDYQREAGIWANTARSFFIDTILSGFPFPKVTLRQIIDLKTRKTAREVIDGQQRLSAIADYSNGKFKLGSTSKNFAGLGFSDLSDEAKTTFLGYEVSVDTVIAASEPEVLEIFRRMNSYTLPLNPAEQRHAEYQGPFKWMIKDLSQDYAEMLITYGTLTRKSASRMGDADLVTELVQVLFDGIVNRSAPTLKSLYKKYDLHFDRKDEVETKTREVLEFIKNQLPEIGRSGLLTGYMLHSLFTALLINKCGAIKTRDADLDSVSPQGRFTNVPQEAESRILELLSAAGRKEVDGRFGEFVRASVATTHRLKQRQVRTLWMLKALRDEL